VRKHQYESIKYVKVCRKIFNTRSQEIVDLCLEMFVSKLGKPMRYVGLNESFWNKFIVIFINNVLCQVFVVNAKKELEQTTYKLS